MSWINLEFSKITSKRFTRIGLAIMRAYTFDGAVRVWTNGLTSIVLNRISFENHRYDFFVPCFSIPRTWPRNPKTPDYRFDHVSTIGRLRATGLDGVFFRFQPVETYAISCRPRGKRSRAPPVTFGYVRSVQHTGRTYPLHAFTFSTYDTGYRTEDAPFNTEKNRFGQVCLWRCVHTIYTKRNGIG